MEIAGVAAVVSGGSSGLGAATARALAAAGARVAILDLDREKGAAIGQEIDGVFAECDVADAEMAVSAIAVARERHGAARILVNCAGIGAAARIVGRDGPHPLDAFERVIRVNLTGTFNMLRLAACDMAALEPLETGERGVIVSTASVAAFEGQIGQAAYAASKGGIAALTLPAARELARVGIRVLAIAPGLFKTPLLGQLPADVQESLGQSIPFPNRLGDPKEFADLVLAMIANPYLNGEIVRLDGALRMPPR
jgi:NAD(P)-dependent dehydrogenase (short-subunit alcohol dehydrogenase family)